MTEQVLGSPGMIAIQAEFEDNVELQIDFDYSLSLATEIVLLDQRLDAGRPTGWRDSNRLV